MTLYALLSVKSVYGAIIVVKRSPESSGVHNKFRTTELATELSPVLSAKTRNSLPSEVTSSKGLFPLRLRVALRGVAWRAIISDSYSTMKSDYRSPRNATRSAAMEMGPKTLP